MMWLAAVLLLSILAGLWRVFHGPTRADRLLAIQLFGTSGAAVLLVMADMQAQPALLDAALILALLAAVVTAALVRFTREVPEND